MAWYLSGWISYNTLSCAKGPWEEKGSLVSITCACISIYWKPGINYTLTIDELVVLPSLTDSCHPLLLNSVGITIKTKLGLVVDEHIHIHINDYRLPWQSCSFTSSGYQALSSCGYARRLIYTIQVYNWYMLYNWYLYLLISTLSSCDGHMSYIMEKKMY